MAQYDPKAMMDYISVVQLSIRVTDSLGNQTPVPRVFPWLRRRDDVREQPFDWENLWDSYVDFDSQEGAGIGRRTHVITVLMQCLLRSNAEDVAIRQEQAARIAVATRNAFASREHWNLGGAVTNLLELPSGDSIVEIPDRSGNTRYAVQITGVWQAIERLT